MKRTALLIDDNDDYAAMLLSQLQPLGYQFTRARSAQEGLENLHSCDPNSYSLIITDITMEGQTAGLKLIRQMRQIGFRGVLIVASTGFNSPIFLTLCRPFMAWWGVDVLIPKKPLKAGDLHCTAISSAGKVFLKNNQL